MFVPCRGDILVVRSVRLANCCAVSLRVKPRARLRPGAPHIRVLCECVGDAASSHSGIVMPRGPIVQRSGQRSLIVIPTHSSGLSQNNHYQTVSIKAVMASGSEILLTQQQHSDLSSIAQSRSLPAGFVFRAKLILMLGEGASFSAIKERLQTTAPTIFRWKQRFLQDGLEGLDTYHPGQQAGVVDTRFARPNSVGDA